MTCEKSTISGNIAELAIAEETCLKELPSSAKFQILEPNSFGDFGGSLSTVAREPISASRQRKKGAPVSIEVSASYESDFTMTNFKNLLQGVFFADIRESLTNIPTNGAANPAKTATEAVVTFTKAIAFSKGDIVLAGGTEHIVASVTGAEVTFEKNVALGAPIADIEFKHVGKSFDASDATLAILPNGNITLTSKTVTFKSEGSFIPGAWVYLEVNTSFGFARISNIASKVITFDINNIRGLTSGVATKCAMYLGDVIKNESEAELIKARSYTLERRIGLNSSGKPQAEYVNGAIANEFTMTTTAEEKVTAELSFVGCDNYQLGIDDGDPVLTNARLPAHNEGLINSSSNVYDSRLNLYTNTGVVPLFAYITELELNVNNNISASRAIGELGAIGLSEGLFEVGGNVTAYFTTFEAVQAVRKNSDAGLYTIYAADKSAFIFDIPLLTLGGGIVNVEQNADITVPFEPMAAESKFGHTLLYQHFPYLPI